MKTSEVIKLMKEGTHCIYNDCPEKEALLRKILNEVSNNRFNKKREVSTKEAFVMDNFNHIISFTYSDSVGYKKINLSEIEPDNEKPYIFYEGEKYYFGEEYEFSDGETGFYREKLSGFMPKQICPFKSDKSEYLYIRKIDHTAKYKKLFLELKEQAEKDGVNLNELI